jgi:ABC-type Fe3+ transport system permease subunit
MASVLTTVENMTLPMAIWSMWRGSGYARASTAAVVVLAFMIPIVFLYWFFGRRALQMAQQ